MQEQYPAQQPESVDRIPEAKKEKKEHEKQQRLTIAFCALLVLAMGIGFLLIFSSEKEEKPLATTDFYAYLYSQLSNYSGTVPQSAPPATVPASSQTVVPTLSQETIPTAAAQTTAEQATAAQTTTARQESTLPSPNGAMHVDLSSDNRFIQIVSRQYGISASLLSAVYVLPDSGQNYVLEWTGQTDANGKLIRSADTLRRCFLIDTAGKVASVAATDSSERENMSAAENKIAMETLIKRVILPELAGNLNG